MTRKHFELIARVVRESGLSAAAREKLAAEFADELDATNPMFDRKRFIAACK